MKPNPPQIVTVAERLMVEIEDAVSRFPVRHRHCLGQGLRQDALDCTLIAQRAWRAQADKPKLAGLIAQMIQLNDAIKLRLQVGHRLQCFTSAGRFEQVATLASDMGRQAGGWQKQILKHLHGQNPAALARPERPETLSTRTTPAPAMAGVQP